MKHPDSAWFDDRPVRIDVCDRCRGCGEVERPYALAMAQHIKGAPNDAIRAMVIGSFGIWAACVEAAEIANRAYEPVAFEFNDTCMVVRPGDDPDRVYRAWWRDTYGETPEETARKR